MPTYKTSDVAEIIGIHPNTVRLYEILCLIPKAERLPNGYRVFTDFHIEQCRLVRIAFKVEVMHDMMQKIISFFPITQGIMLMKSTFLNLPVLSSWVPVSVMSGVAIACGVVSVKFFKWE